MPEGTQKYFRTDDKNGVVLSERNGKYTISAGYVNRDGDIKLSWGRAKDAETFIPIAARTGNVDTTLSILSAMITELNAALDGGTQGSTPF